ncbi:MAG: hypothetical protein M1814_002071 [Vezdaea aestivalis]|nr:MAG: hypothetical protein M1814_002071 [Vezdaea aestivalis]
MSITPTARSRSSSRGQGRLRGLEKGVRYNLEFEIPFSSFFGRAERPKSSRPRREDIIVVEDEGPSRLYDSRVAPPPSRFAPPHAPIPASGPWNAPPQPMSPNGPYFTQEGWPASTQQQLQQPTLVVHQAPPVPPQWGPAAPTPPPVPPGWGPAAPIPPPVEVQIIEASPRPQQARPYEPPQRAPHQPQQFVGDPTLGRQIQDERLRAAQSRDREQRHRRDAQMRQQADEQAQEQQRQQEAEQYSEEQRLREARLRAARQDQLAREERRRRQEERRIQLEQQQERDEQERSARRRREYDDRRSFELSETERERREFAERQMRAAEQVPRYVRPRRASVTLHQTPFQRSEAGSGSERSWREMPSQAVNGRDQRHARDNSRRRNNGGGLGRRGTVHG